jgi:predicted metal-dependent HD superfamily phosphohydrolase
MMEGRAACTLTTMLELERWAAHFVALGLSPPDDVYAELCARYGEPHRAYHTLEHLRECLAWLAEVRELAVHPDEIALALWFHDAIYDPRAHDNEERSAAWAERVLRSAGASTEVAHRVAALVLATKHDVVPEPGDAALLVDVDLSILGAERARFDAYEAQVRREYAWVPEAAYREGRARVLRSFLGRPRIYATAHFHDRLEARARDHLRRSLAALERGAEA